MGGGGGGGGGGVSRVEFNCGPQGGNWKLLGGGGDQEEKKIAQ